MELGERFAHSWWWRLLPGNPIFLRVVGSGSRSRRHLVVRAGYLIALFAALLVWGGMFAPAESLGEAAKRSTQTFVAVSLVQLVLMCFIAPVFTAGAITQERDANTFHILLATPLSSPQIVVGSLLGRLFFIWTLLLAGFPIFCVTMLFGGVTLAAVIQSLLLAGVTGLVMGSAAILVSVLSVGTRRTILAFFVAVAVYLIGVGALGLSPWGRLPEATPHGTLPGLRAPAQMSWLAPFHPLLALLVVIGVTPAPSAADLQHYSALWRWMLVDPALGYLVFTTTVSVILCAIAIALLRRVTRDGSAARAAWRAWLTWRSGPRTPRRVWNNPVAWREACTRASAGGRSALRWVFVGAALLAGVALWIAHLNGAFSPPERVRYWLTALLWVELTGLLLMVTATGATALTREKESRTLELLLTTPLTSRYILGGVIRGLVSFVAPIVAVPAITLLLFTASDLLMPADRRATTPEAMLIAPAILLTCSALGAVVGLQASLHCRRSTQAVMLSAGIMLGTTGLLGACVTPFLDTTPQVAAGVSGLTPYPALQSLVDYSGLMQRFSAVGTPVSEVEVRVTRMVTSVISLMIYAGIAHLVYQSIVREFDMTVRRQSA